VPSKPPAIRRRIFYKFNKGNECIKGKSLRVTKKELTLTQPRDHEIVRAGENYMCKLFFLADTLEKLQ
jgi:hypothetical protein